MACDEELANRIRQVMACAERRFAETRGLVSAEQEEVSYRAVREQRMFGGITWMVDGNMAVGVYREGLLVRTGKEGMEAALAREHVGPMEMGERTMDGFVVVEPAGITTHDDLHEWVHVGIDFALSLPPK